MKLSYFLLAVSVSFIIACNGSEEPPADPVQTDSSAVEITEEGLGNQDLQLIGIIDPMDNMPFINETEGIMLAAIEEKLGDRLSVANIFFTGPHENGKYYLEGRSKDPMSSGTVAIPLIREGDYLYADPNDVIYACFTPEQGACTFIMEDGEISGCNCVCPDTTSVCEFFKGEDATLPYIGETAPAS
jgi:hypothetical protein